MPRLTSTLRQLSWTKIAPVAGLTAVVGAVVILASFAASPIAFEAETGTLTSGATVTTAGGQSGTGAVKFGAAIYTPTPTPSGVPNPLKIMPLGDSLTQGGVNGGYSGGLYPPTINGYRLALLNLLTGYNIDYVGPYRVGDSSLPDWDEAGNSGACIKVSPCSNTMYPLTAGWLNTYNPDLVIMQGGGNDYSKSGITTATIEGYMEDWIQLVFQTKPNVKIIVSGTEQWYPELEALTKAYVENLQVQGKAIRFVPYGGSVATIDGTHPSPAGYITWANELAPKVRELYPQ